MIGEFIESANEAQGRKYTREEGDNRVHAPEFIEMSGNPNEANDLNKGPKDYYKTALVRLNLGVARVLRLGTMGRIVFQCAPIGTRGLR